MEPPVTTGLEPMPGGALVHPLALCESASVGAGTRVWAFAHVLPGAVIGRDGNVCDHTFVENDVVAGDRLTLKPGVQLWDGLRLGDDVFVGPNVTFANDPFPRSRQRPQEYARTTVQDGASIGANATVLPGVTIGRQAMVGAGSVVVHDVPPRTIVVGNPARIVGYLDDAGNRVPPRPDAAATDDRPGGVELRRLVAATDLRGSLVAGEAGSELPFVPRRVFTVYSVPSTEVRGQHAHKACDQFLVAVAGRVTVEVDDGSHRQSHVLDDPSLGLHVPAGVWAEQHHFSADAVLLVLASMEYDPDDYLRDYSAFEAFLRERP